MLWLLWKERRHARAAARASLVDFKNFGDSHSDLHPKDLYIAWVEHRLACGRPEAQSIVRQAAASFAEWPNDCELCFRHVVQYTVITAYLANHPTNSGTMANMVVEIARSIPLAL